jgi:hypothetical protein
MYSHSYYETRKNRDEQGDQSEQSEQVVQGGEGGQLKCTYDEKVHDITKCINIVKKKVDEINSKYVVCLTKSNTSQEIEKCLNTVETQISDLSIKASQLALCKVKGCSESIKDKETLIKCLTNTPNEKHTVDCFKGKTKPKILFKKKMAHSKHSGDHSKHSGDHSKHSGDHSKHSGDHSKHSGDHSKHSKHSGKHGKHSKHSTHSDEFDKLEAQINELQKKKNEKKKKKKKDSSPTIIIPIGQGGVSGKPITIP